MKRLLAAALLCLLAACADTNDEAVVPEPETTAPPAAEVAAPAEAGAMINPETASREELLRVPHMNAALVDALIAARPLETMLEVDSILGRSLSADQRKEVYRTMWRPMDLNTASRAEILLIPDVDRRMPHEFDEYRPYPDMDRFRREIGKYVGAEEAARYEKYVEIRN